MLRMKRIRSRVKGNYRKYKQDLEKKKKEVIELVRAPAGNRWHTQRANWTWFNEEIMYKGVAWVNKSTRDSKASRNSKR